MRELQWALKEFKGEAKKIVRQELRKTAKEFQTDLKSDFEEDTGALKRKIKVRAGKRSNKRISVETIIDTPYAANIEFGTEDIEPRGSGRDSFRRNAPSESTDLEIRLLKAMERKANQLGRIRGI